MKQWTKRSELEKTDGESNVSDVKMNATRHHPSFLATKTRLFTAQHRTTTMSTGWRYSVQIPDFTKEERHGEEIVVYYQVDVLVQAPGATEPAPPTAVWRRFSEFRQLHANLKGVYPEIFKKKELEPPSKRSLRFVNNNDRLLHERRQQLEAWLWNLLKSNEIAHSRFMKVFLQLNLAVRGATASSSAPLSQRDGREDDEQLDTSSDLSAPSGMTRLSHAYTDVQTPGTAKYSTRTESMDAYRMGLRVAQRRELKHLMKMISTSLERVNQEAHDVRGENSSLRQENRSLEEQVTSLNHMIKDGQLSQDERYEELCQCLEEKESALKKTVDSVHRLEASMKESQKQCEAMESEMRSVKQEGATELEAKVVQISLLESRIQSQSVAHASLEREIQEAKQKARKDHRLLAEAVKALRQERNAQLEKIKEQETKLREMQGLAEQLEDAEEQRKEHIQRIEALEAEQTAARMAWEQQLSKVQEESQLKLVHLKERHCEETGALKDIIEELEKTLVGVKNAHSTLQEQKEALEQERHLDEPPEDGVRLVIDVTVPEKEGVQSEVAQLKEELQRLQCENTQLKETISDVVAENTSLKSSTHKTRNGISESDKEAANLDGLLRTIQELQEEKRILLEASQSPGDELTSMKRFADWAENVCHELHDYSSSAESMDSAFNAEEADRIIERVANSNGRLQLLTAKVEEMKASIPQDRSSMGPLFASVTNVLSDFIQKCKEINEMKLDAYLSRTTEQTPVISAEPAKSQGLAAKKTHPRNPDSNVSEDDAASGTPSVKMFLGGIGAKMSQGSQGFMNFMQRGAASNLPSEADPVSLARRSPQP